MNNLGEVMEQILLAYSLLKETVVAMMMLYKKHESKSSLTDGDTDYFDIVAGMLLGDTLSPYLFIICQDYVLRTTIDLIKENGFKLAKEIRQKIPRTNYDGRGLRRWHSSSSKYTRLSRIPAT